MSPHSMEIGGSQTNAIELAAACRDRGHEVVVYADPGPLSDRVHELGLELLPRRRARIRPGVETALDLRRLVVERGFELLHGYEWPPILEGYAAARLTPRAVAVGTVMSMSVAPFLPSGLPLVVGTTRIRDHVAPRRRGEVALLEPPVDTRLNAPGLDLPPPVELDRDALTVTVVSRLAQEMKLEGILSAIRTVDRLADVRRIQLLIVGDGPAGDQVRAAAGEVNRRHDRDVVLAVGEWPDPRWAYAAADVCLGMGGSALRALAFGKPLVVQGERGFFELLTETSLPTFLEQGWYGVGPGPEHGEGRLESALAPALDSPAVRGELGELGRRLAVQRFGLDTAAGVQERIYADALAGRDSLASTVGDALRSGVGLLDYKVRRRLDRARGLAARDDFNARPV